MKWLLSVLCFTTATAFSQAKEPLLEKLKETEKRLSGTLPRTIPDQRVRKDQEKPKVTIIVPKNNNGPGAIPNLMPRQQQKPLIMDAYQESVVIALPQDNMPCIVPNMELYKRMPNAGNKRILETPIDPGIYLQKPKS